MRDGRSRAASAVGAVAFLVAGIAVFVPGVFAHGEREQGRVRSISVSGTGVVSAPPDVAVVRLGVQTRDADVGRALSAASTNMRAVTSALRRNGVAEGDITTVDYRVGFVRSPRLSDRGGSLPPASGSSAGTPSPGSPTGYYLVTDVAAVTIRSLSRLPKILDDALSAGADEVQGIGFEISNPASLERAARAKAYAEAHERALQIAKLSGVTLGELMSVSTGGGPVPTSGTVFRAEALAAPAVNPGSLEISVTLHVVYRIKD